MEQKVTPNNNPMPPAASEADGESAPKSLGDILDSHKLSRVHFVGLTLVVTGALFEVLEQLILGSLGPTLQEAFGIDATQVSFLSTLTLLAVVVGGLTGGLLGDRAGRRTVLAISLFIYCAGSVFAAFAPSYQVLGVARVVTGLGVGGEIAVGLTYLSEITPTRFRGVFVSLFNTVSAGVGSFFTFAYTRFVLGPVAGWVGAGPDAWRWVFGLLGLPAVLVALMRRYLPETPAFLMSRGDIDAANRALARLIEGKLRIRRDDEVRAYVDARTAAVSESARSEATAWGALARVLKPPLRQRTIALGIVALMAWGVSFSIIIIMPVLLVDRGYSITGSHTMTMVQNTGALIGSIIATLASYRIPHRRVVLWGSVGAGLSILGFGLRADSVPAILISGFLIQAFMYGTNTTIWLWSPELYPTALRAFGTALIVNTGFFG